MPAVQSLRELLPATSFVPWGALLLASISALTGGSPSSTPEDVRDAEAEWKNWIDHHVLQLASNIVDRRPNNDLIEMFGEAF